MPTDFSELVVSEVFKLKSLYSELLIKGCFNITSSDIDKIIFTNDNGFKLIFIYDTSRYITGKYMMLNDIKICKENSSYTLEDLVVFKDPEFVMKNYLDKERKLGISRKRAYKNLFCNILQNTVEFDTE